MKKKLIWIAPLAITAIVAFVFAGGWVVQHLWNWLVPWLFGWHQVSFWQALGLLALCRILFGSWGGHHGGRSNFRRRMGEKWDRMTPEEREKFRQKWGSRCGGFGEPSSGAKEPV
ncbi:MAG TPA: hypothetical protein VE377_06115 [Candidatus Dormibacteraeota bacterium]|nr:hypothetical protein [Candidatus Dormibacteraeota bacterium]